MAKRDIDENMKIWREQFALRESFRDAIWADPKLTKAVPATLLHYTSLDAYYSITSSHTIRCSRAEISNDAAEMTLAAGVVNEALLERDARTSLSEDLIKNITRLFQLNSASTLVSCFTEPRKGKPSDGLLPADILSMWRAYSNSGEGVAIHFEGQKLKSLTANADGLMNGMRLLHAIYDPDEQFEIVKNAVRLAKPELLDKMPSHDAEWNAWAARTIAAELRSFSSMFKHAGFVEENEWRLVCTLAGVGAPNLTFTERSGIKRGCLNLVVRTRPPSPVELDAGSSQKVQGFFSREQGSPSEDFLEHDTWSDSVDLLPITGVSIGPSTKQSMAAISVLEWARHHGYRWKSDNGGAVRVSQIPYRG